MAEYFLELFMFYASQDYHPKASNETRTGAQKLLRFLGGY